MVSPPKIVLEWHKTSESVQLLLLWLVSLTVMLLQLACWAAKGVGVFHQLSPARPSLLLSDVGCLTGCCQITSLFLGPVPCSSNKAHKLSLWSWPIFFLHLENSPWPLSDSGSQTSLGLASSLASKSPIWISLAVLGGSCPPCASFLLIPLKYLDSRWSWFLNSFFCCSRHKILKTF